MEAAVLKFLTDPYTFLFLKEVLRWIAIIIVASILGAAGSLFFGATGLLGGLHSFFTMPVIAAIVAIILDRTLPEPRV